MLTLTGVSMRFGGQLLFEDVNWQLAPRGHYGLVGANGAGKSTLLRIMAGELAPERGTVGRVGGLRVGTLGQDHFRFDDACPLDVVLMGRPDLWRARVEQRRLLEAAQGTPDPATGERLAELELELHALGGYAADAEAARLLSGLGLRDAQHARPMRELSGGFRLRVLLAQALFARPDLLLLDEPTNHLDLASIGWLEGYLRGLDAAFVVISHDRHFLNAVCDAVADLDYRELRLYAGNYDAFEAAKALAVAQREAEAARAEERIEELQQFIDRFRAKASKARQAQSRKKQLERIEIPEVKRSSRRAPAFEFGVVRPSGRDVLTVRGVTKGFGGTPVLDGVSFSVERGERVAVVGPNGIGKSTLLKIIHGELEPDAGEVALGYEVHPGYFAQNHADLLGGGVTAYRWLAGAGGTGDVSAVRGMLGRMLLGGDDADKRVDDLSGGEATRLVLGALMLRRPNLLILDEPTNHLDLEAREALMRALEAYPGTMLLVSHDRHFVSHVATRVLALTPRGVEDFHGTYEEYLARAGADYLAAPAPSRLARGAPALHGVPNGGPNGGPPKPGNGYVDRKNRRALTARLRRDVERLEAEVSRLEAAIATLEASFGDPDYYLDAPPERLEADVQRRRELQERLADVLAQWEAASAELEALAAD